MRALSDLGDLLHLICAVHANVKFDLASPGIIEQVDNPPPLTFQSTFTETFPWTTKKNLLLT